MTGRSGKRPGRRRLSQIFAQPVLLSVISLTGLVAALLIDGWEDGVAAVAAGAGLVALLWIFARRR